MKSDKVLLIADSPNTPTGYATAGIGVAWCLAGKYDVHYLGLYNQYDAEVTVKRHNISRKLILHKNETAHLAENDKLWDWGQQSARKLIEEIEPDAIITIQDVQMVSYIPDLITNKNLVIKLSDVITRHRLSDYALKMQLRRGKILSEESRKKLVWIQHAPIDGEPLWDIWYDTFLASDELIAYSKFGQNIFKKYLNLYVDYLYFGVDDTILKPSKKSDELRDYFVIGNINRNQPRKQPIRTLEAFAKFAKNKDDVKLWMQMNWMDKAGYPIEFYAKQNGILEKMIRPVQFPNWDSVKEFYRNIDLNVNSTAGEGLGLVALEGFAMKKPYIATDYTTTHELVNDPPFNPRGIAVPYSQLYWELPKIGAPKRALIDTDKLAETFEYAYTHRDEIYEMGKNGYEWVKQFTWKNLQFEWHKIVERNLEKLKR